tara:strand:- start:353 stop:625 length:273 start_codon:yes stop_codon:yes gene_type:complete
MLTASLRLAICLLPVLLAQRQVPWLWGWAQVVQAVATWPAALGSVFLKQLAEFQTGASALPSVRVAAPCSLGAACRQLPDQHHYHHHRRT